jgi:hypothetical protein
LEKAVMLANISRKAALAIALTAAMGIIATKVHASPVTLGGGFLDFTTPFGPPSLLQSFVNGTEITAPNPFPATTTISFGTPVETVDFVNQAAFCGPSYNPGCLVPPVPNEIKFTINSAPIDVVVGQEFLLGTLSFTNGIWTGSADLSFELTTTSSDPTLNEQIFADTVHMNLTADGPTAADRADTISFVGHPEIGPFSVFELADGNNIGTVDLYGKIDGLEPTRFANPTGGGFLPGTPVDEPGTLAILVLGVAVLGIMGRRKPHLLFTRG